MSRRLSTQEINELVERKARELNEKNIQQQIKAMRERGVKTPDNVLRNVILSRRGLQ